MISLMIARNIWAISIFIFFKMLIVTLIDIAGELGVFGSVPFPLGGKHVRRGAFNERVRGAAQTAAV